MILEARVAPLNMARWSPDLLDIYPGQVGHFLSVSARAKERLSFTTNISESNLHHSSVIRRRHDGHVRWKLDGQRACLQDLSESRPQREARRRC